LLLALGIRAGQVYAAVGDGIIVYGANASTSVPQTRDYTASTTAWSNPPSGLPNTVSGQEAVINRVIVRANQNVNEYVCGVLTTTNSRLTVYTWYNGTWTQDWFDNAPASALFQVFDIAYEQNSGNCMVVYSNGATTNELSYRRRVDGVWLAAATINSLRTTGVVQWVRLASRPNSNEIALAFSDANDDLNAFVWFNDGATYSWQAEPPAVQSTTLSAIDSPKFDIAYEQVSGRVVIVYSIDAVAGVGVARKVAGATAWTNTADDATFLDIADYIDIASEPGTDYIAVGTIADAARDMQLGIWNNGAWTNRWNNWETATANPPTPSYWTPVACGWAGTGVNRRAVFVYADVAATTLSYFTWVKGAANPEQAANTPSTVSPPFVSGIKQNIRVKQDPAFATNGQMWVITVDSNSDLWPLIYNGTGWSWPPVALETATTVAVPMCADADFTSWNPTFAELIDFQARPIANGIELNWQTSSELGTQGYRIWRSINDPKGRCLPNDADGRQRGLSSLTEITKDLVKARGSLLFGASYSYLDTTALLNEDYLYCLEEIEKSGGSQQYGPISPNPPNSPFDKGGLKGDFKGHLKRDGRWEVEGKIVPRCNNDAQSGSSSPCVQINDPEGRCLPDDAEGRQRGLPSVTKSIKALQSGPADLKIAIKEEGFYEIYACDLTGLGWNISQINPNQISLFNNGNEVPIRVITWPSFAIQFYGKSPPSNRYTDSNIYYLKISTGPTIRMKEAESIGTGPVNLSYWETIRVEKNESYWNEFKQENHWFYADELFAPGSKDISFNIDHYNFEYVNSPGAEPVQLRLALQGASGLNGMNPGHQKVNIYINGEFLGTAEWTGDNAYLFTSPVVLGFINEGKNTLTIELPNEIETIQQCVLIDYLEITYPREFVARQDQISFTAPDTGIQYYQINGFSAQNINVFVVHPEQPSEIDYITNFSVISESSQFRVLFGYNTALADRYFVLRSDRMKRPLSITLIGPVNLKNTSNQADYIIITPSEWIPSLEPLIAHRRGGGLSVTVAPAEDIYDEFNNGLLSPVAIREFLKWTYEHWQKPAPRFVLLIGDSTFDYKDYWQSGQTYPVPAYLVQTPVPENAMGETASDHWFVNFDDDILPEMIIGRLPVRTSDELTGVINKIISYETSGRFSLPERVLFCADAGDDDFESGAEDLARMLPADYEAVKLYLSQLEAGAVKQGIITNTNQGLFMFTYIGHSGVGVLSSQRVLENSDITSLNNTNKYPLMLVMGCLSGYFIYPGSVGLESLTEVLLRAEDRGIIAAIAPTGLSSPPEQLVFAKGFYEALFNKPGSTLGSAHYQAMESLVNNQSLVGTPQVNNIIQTFNLFGDPALNIGSNPVSGSSGRQKDYSRKCGSLGIEALILIGLLMLIKSRKSRLKSG